MSKRGNCERFTTQRLVAGLTAAGRAVSDAPILVRAKLFETSATPNADFVASCETAIRQQIACEGWSVIYAVGPTGSLPYADGDCAS